MSETKHIIEKVFVDVNTKSAEKGYFIKNNISAFFRDEIFPLIEKLFDSFDAGNEIIRFENMKIDLQIKKWNNTEEIKSGIETSFKKNFAAEIKEFKSKTKNKLPQSATKLSVEDSMEASFFHFLEKGYLPWFGKEEYLAEISKPEKWKETILRNSFTKRLSSVLVISEEIILRFVSQFPDEIIIILLSEVSSSLRTLKNETLALIKLLSIEERNLFLKFLIELSLKTGQTSGEKTLLELINHLSVSQTDETVFSLNSFRKYIGKLKFGNAYSNKAISEFVNPKDAVSVPKRLINGNSLNGSKNGTKSWLKEEMLSNHTEIVKRQITKDGFFESGINEVSVSNAGLIILHPFLKYFFLELGILNQQDQMIENRKLLAVQSLHYLATANENVFESSLVFEKFLCGIPLNKTLSKSSVLTTEIKAETDNLLSATIKNWPALKSTSPNGLRELFIQREGKLIVKNGKCKLLVERKPQDILLEKLSWNISVIKLPWKKDLLMVDW